MASSPCLLSDNILKRLICHECFRYLSVPPVVSNVLGESRCGRCYDSNEANVESNSHSTESFYNVVAERFLFRCINHYNGCSQLVGLADAEQHEKTCIVPNQDCFFCSFSGVLSQIIYHCLKVHTENVTYDGKLYFFLNDMSFQRKIIYVLNDNNIFLVTVSAVNELLTIEILTLTQTSPSHTNQFGVKFFKPDGDTSGVDYLHTEYGLLDIDLPNYFEKDKDELATIFGSGVKVGCQILVGHFSFERELEFKEKFCKLSHCEKELSNLTKEQADKEQNFLQQTIGWKQKLTESDERCQSAIDIIKNMSYNFRCSGCQKVSLEEIYCCPKNHFYCVKCLTNVCRVCDSVQEFERLDQIGNFEVSCDWPGCEILTPIKTFIVHKTSCANRVYECPATNCRNISLDILLNHGGHWPWGSFENAADISCEMNRVIDKGWIVNGDIYHVTMRLDTIIRVTIDDINVINKNVTFKCEGSNSKGQNINFFNFCRKCDIENVNSYYNKITVSIA